VNNLDRDFALLRGEQRTLARAFLVAALLVWPSGAWAAECPARTDAIETDRPDTTNSSLVIPYGSLQMENGINWAVRQGSQILDGSETRVRFGVYHCGEVLVDVPNYFATFHGLASSGLSDLVVSVKRQLFIGQRSFSLSAVGGLGFPVSGKSSGEKVYSPYAQFPWSRTIAEDWSLNGMLTVTWSTARDANSPNVEPSQVIDVGGGWHVTRRQQLDFHVGVGLTRSSPDHYVGVGYSFRIDGLL
jgi:hypothetical protein